MFLFMQYWRHAIVYFDKMCFLSSNVEGVQMYILIKCVLFIQYWSTNVYFDKMCSFHPILEYMYFDKMCFFSSNIDAFHPILMDTKVYFDKMCFLSSNVDGVFCTNVYFDKMCLFFSSNIGVQICILIKCVSFHIQYWCFSSNIDAFHPILMGYKSVFW